MVQTHRHKEDIAVRNLEQQGFVSFLPRFRRRVRHARKTREVLAPLFPGYLFVRLDLTKDRWRSVNSTLGVRSLVSSSDTSPSLMPDVVMYHVMSRCEGELVRNLLPDLQIGASVRVMNGPFADRLAEVVELDKQGRVSVLFELLGQQNRVAMDVSALGPALG